MIIKNRCPSRYNTKSVDCPNLLEKINFEKKLSSLILLKKTVKKKIRKKYQKKPEHKIDWKLEKRKEVFIIYIRGQIN